MTSGKSPGPDGLTSSYFLKYADLLQPTLTTYLNSLTKTGRIPPDVLRAHITVLPKEGRDPAFCQSCRPISLLNLDIKILAKILANRLKEFIGEIVYEDQVRFVLGREDRDNSQRAIRLIHWGMFHKLPCLVLSPEVEKTFDRIDCLFKSLGLD